MNDLRQLSEQNSLCYLTTKGRVTGRSHEIEIWFVIHVDVLYMMSGYRERSNWVKNIQSTPMVKVRIGETEFVGNARIVTEETEEEFARTIWFDKYHGKQSFSPDLTGWRDTSLPIAVSIHIHT